MDTKSVTDNKAELYDLVQMWFKTLNGEIMWKNKPLSSVKKKICIQ